MTSSPTEEDTSIVILRALSVLAHDGQDSDARALLAGSEVLVPADPLDDGMDASRPKLPLAGRTVLVFTSEARMARVLPDVLCYRVVPLGVLPAHWPAGGRALTIDPGSPDMLTLSADGVRLLLGDA